MTRKKVKLAYIANDSARKATFKKRKKGLLKKVHELSTLCGIEACAIIYGPNDTQPEVWPSPLGVQRVLAKFDRMPEMEQNKKMMNQESFLKQRLEKLSEQLKKQLRDNREKEITRVMFQSLTGRGFDGLNLVDLNDLGWVTEQYKKEVQQKLDRLNNVPLSYTPMPLAAVPSGESQEGGEIVPPEIAPHYEVNMDHQRPSWFMEMMNQQDQMGFPGEEAMLPFGDNGFAAPLWPNGPFA